MPGVRTGAVTFVALLLIATIPAPAPAAGGGLSVASAAKMLEAGFTGTGTESDPWTLAGKKISARNGTALSLSELAGHVVLRDLELEGKILLEAHRVTSLRIEGLRGNATAEGLLVQDVEKLVVRDVNVSVRDTAGLFANVSDGDIRGFNVSRANDGLVLADYKGVAGLGWLHVEASGVRVMESHVFLQNFLVVGACAGGGVEVFGGEVTLVGNAAACDEFGIRVVDAKFATLEGNGAEDAGEGIALLDTPFTSKGDVVVDARRAAFLVRGEGGAFEAPVVRRAAVGILAEGVDVEVVGGVFEATGEAAVRAFDGRVVEAGNRIDGAGIGLDLEAVELHGKDGHGPTAMSLVGTGARLAGVLAPREDWKGFSVRTCDLAVLAERGGDAAMRSLSVDGCAAAGTVRSGAKLTVDGGTWAATAPVGRGFKVEGAELSTARLAVKALGGTFVEANDSTYRDERSTVGASTVALPGHGVKSLRGVVHLNGTSITRAVVGVEIEGLPAASAGEVPRASLLEATTLLQSKERGVHLKDAAALEVVGGVIRASGAFGGADGTGMLAEGESAFVLRGGATIRNSFEDGLRWTGLSKIPASTLFPPTGPGATKTASPPRLDGAFLLSNDGNGFVARDVAKGVGFAINNSTLSLNGANGAQLKDVHATVTKSRFGHHEPPGPLTLCIGVCDFLPQRNGANGIRSEWTIAETETFRVVDSTFYGNKRNGLFLTGHSKATEIVGNDFKGQGVSVPVAAVHSDTDARYGHDVFLWNGTGDEGPLVRGNSMNTSLFCSVKANNSAVRVIENTFLGDDNACGVFVQELPAPQTFRILGNTFNQTSGAVTIVRASGEVAGNRFWNSSDASVGVVGSGSQTVTVKDNEIRGATGIAVHVCGIDCHVDTCAGSQICWANTKGTIEHNLVDTGDSPVVCNISCPGTTQIEILAGPETPTIVGNVIRSWGDGLAFPGAFNHLANGYSADHPAQFYTAKGRIVDNVFGGRLRGGAFFGGTAISEPIHGDYGEDDTPNAGEPGFRVHFPPTGVNVEGNTFEQGIVVDPHRFQTDTGNAKDESFKYAESGKNRAYTHNFGGTAGGTPGVRAPAFTFTPGTTARLASYDLQTKERPPGCGGYRIAPPALDVNRTDGREFALVARVAWAYEGRSIDRNCDSESDIRIQFLVDRQVVAEFTGPLVRDGKISHLETFPEDHLYKVEVRVSLDSKGYSTGKQQKSAFGNAWPASKPYLELESNRGTVFVGLVPVAVTVTGKQIGDSESLRIAVTVFKWRGEERRLWGMNPKLAINPAIDCPVARPTPCVLSAVTVMPGGAEQSDVATLSFKIIPFPAAFEHYLTPGETEVNIATDADGKESVSYKWELTIVKFEKEFESGAPILGGEYEGALSINLKVTGDTTGAGSVGGQIATGLSAESSGGRFELTMGGRGDLGGTVRVDDIRVTGITGAVKLEGDAIWYFLPSTAIPPLAAVKEAPLIGRAVDVIDKLARVGVGFGAEAEGVFKLEVVENATCIRLISGLECTGEGTLKPRVNVVVKAEISENLEFKGYGKGSIFFVVEVARPEGVAQVAPIGWVSLKSMGYELEAGVEAKVYKYERAWKIVTSGAWFSPGRGFNLTDDSGWGIPERTWTDGGTFVGRDLLVANLTRDAEPSFSDAGGRQALVYVRDDLADPYPRSGEIVAATRTGSAAWKTWNLTADQLADFSPAVAPVGTAQKWLVVWAKDGNEALATTTPLSEDSGDLFEAYALVVDGAGVAQAAPTRLTTDALLDAAPAALAAPDGSALAVWAKNRAGVLLPDAGRPDEIWAAKVTPAGALGPAGKAFDAVAEAGRALAWNGTRLHLASVVANGTVVLRTSNLAGATTSVVLGDTLGAPATVAATARADGVHVAWARANASAGNGTVDLIETRVAPSGERTTRLVAAGVAPDGVEYATGEPRTLAWTESGGEGARLVRAQFVAATSTWGEPEVVLESGQMLGMVGARAGASLGAAFTETELVESTRAVPYRGPNQDSMDADAAPGEIDVTRNVTSVRPGATQLRLRTLAPLAEPAPLQPLEIEQMTLTPLNGTIRVDALVRNVGDAPSPPRNATLHFGPEDGVRAPAARLVLPFVANGTARRATTEIPLPATGDGWWRASIAADGVSGYEGVLRLQPEWRLPQERVDRDGATVHAVLENAGLRGGSTTVRAFALRPDGTLGAAVGNATVTVAAGREAPVQISLPAGTGAVLLRANPEEPGRETDQADFGRTVAIAEGSVPLFDLVADLTVPPGTHPFRVDLSRFAGAGNVLSASFDGAPLTLQVADGIVTGSVAIAPGVHKVVVKASDLLGAPRTLTLVLRTPGALDSPGGSNGDPTNTTPETVAQPSGEAEGPWWQRLVPATDAPLLALAAVSAALLALRRRR